MFTTPATSYHSYSTNCTPYTFYTSSHSLQQKSLKSITLLPMCSSASLSKYTLQSNQQLLFPCSPIYYLYISYIHSFTQQQGITTNPSLLSYIIIFTHPFTNFTLILSIRTLTLKNNNNNHQYLYSIHFIYTLHISYNHQILH